MNLRSITHMHTGHSSDCTIPPARLMDWLTSAGVDLAVVCDHDSFRGALDCRRIAKERGLSIQVPVAAEIRTDRGDVIVIFDDDDETPQADDLKKWHRLELIVRDVGGLIWLPHPYQSHEYVEELAAAVDVVEVFNARCSDEQNRNAAYLCERHGRVPGYGADVHRQPDFGRCVVEYEDHGSPTASLRHAPTPIETSLNKKSSLMLSGLTYGRKHRRPFRMAYYALRWAQHATREARGSVHRY